MSNRCDWAELNELMHSYHDTEWGVPLHDDPKLFEYLILDGFQPGLSWNIILSKRENFRQAFFQFDPLKNSQMDPAYIPELLQNKNIVRNRSKIEAVVTNARAFINIQHEFTSFNRYIWGFVDGNTVQNSWELIKQIPAVSPLSEQISLDLRKRGFKFVGPTICYAYIQAIGMVNDHLTGCFRHAQLRASSH